MGGLGKKEKGREGKKRGVILLGLFFPSFAVVEEGRKERKGKKKKRGEEKKQHCVGV